MRAEISRLPEVAIFGSEIRVRCGLRNCRRSLVLSRQQPLLGSHNPEHLIS